MLHVLATNFEKCSQKLDPLIYIFKDIQFLILAKHVENSNFCATTRF